MSKPLPAAVLAWAEEPLPRAGALRALWRRIADLGWLEPRPSHVVIQVTRRRRSPVVGETALSLVDFLRDRLPGSRLEVIDPGGGMDTMQIERGRVRRLADEGVLAVAAVALPGEVTVPELWFESCFLVTVAEVGPDEAGGFAAILDAQADPLRELGNPPIDAALLYEAHRLSASDLAVACGGGEQGAPVWWIAGSSDIAVDRAIAAAAGLDAQEVFSLRALARHEVLPPPPRVMGTLPRLARPATYASRVLTRALAARVRAARHMLAHDLAMLRANLNRVPGFVRRRLARATRSAA